MGRVSAVVFRFTSLDRGWIMKTFFAALAFFSALASGWAATTINATNKFACGANLGWVNCRGDTSNGAIIGEYVCSGYIYAANLGWINLGSGAPANGIQYQNLADDDFGVNHDGFGNLRGYAYGANVGWINFESTGTPRLNLLTGKLSGYAYSANCGWISLSNAMAHVQTDTVAPGADTDGDGIPDAWEQTWFGNLTTANKTSDYDADGSTDRQEALADTNPLDAEDNLRITSYIRYDTYNILLWTSKPTRLYRMERRAAFDPDSAWELHIGLDWLGWDNIGFADFGPQGFYRIKAVRPLSP